MANPERGALLECIETPAADTRALGRLRKIVAVLAALGSAAVWLGRLPLTVAMVATLGALLAVAYWRLGSRDVRRAASGEPSGLWLYAHGLLQRDGDETRWIPWAGVERVSIDEELLRIRLHRRAEADAFVTGHYPGKTIEEVATALARAAGVPGPYEGSQSGRDDLQ